MNAAALPAGLLLALAAVAGWAQPADLTDAPACRRAMESLDAHEAAAARDRSALAALEAARRQAAVACLGGRASAASAVPRAAQPAVPTAPATTPRPAAAAVPVRPAPAPVPVPRPTPPLTITACDANGCWASDGTRLQRAGSQLLGPKGLCTTQGALLTCPP